MPRTRSVYCVLALRVPCVIPAVATIYTPAYAHSVLVPGPSVLYVRGIVRLRRAAPPPVRPRFFYTRVPDSVSFCARGGAHGGRRRPPARWDCAGALARGGGGKEFSRGDPAGGSMVPLILPAKLFLNIATIYHTATSQNVYSVR